MTTFLESRAIVGSRVRLNETFLPSDARSPREKFLVKEAPAHNQSGRVVLEGLLSNAMVVIGTQENAISEVCED